MRRRDKLMPISHVQDTGSRREEGWEGGSSGGSRELDVPENMRTHGCGWGQTAAADPKYPIAYTDTGAGVRILPGLHLC